MASETKRQNVGGGKAPVALPNNSPSQPPGNMVSLEAALSGAIGARIRVSTAPPISSTFEGILHTADPITNLVAINVSAPPPPQNNPSTSQSSWNVSSATPSGSYRIMPISQLTSFTILSLPTPASQPSPITPLDLPSLRAREATAIRKIREREARRGPKGISKEAQDIFDAISRTHPARWQGTSMVVNDAVLIEKPYHTENCKPIGGAAAGREGVERIKKVLDMERKKLELKGARFDVGSVTGKGQSSQGQTPIGGSRKGG